MFVQAFMAIATAKKTVPAVWALSFIALAYDPTASGAAAVALVIALSNTWMAYLKSKTDAADRAATIAAAAADRTAAAEERRIALAEAAAERALASDERRLNVLERKALLAEAERTARELASNTKVTAQAVEIIGEVSKTTTTIEGHVNSAATAAIEERKAKEIEKEATRQERAREVAMLHEMIDHLRKEAAELARAKASTELAAAVAGTSPTGGQAHDSTEQLETIAESTADTAQNTKDTVHELRDAVKEGVKDAAADALDALKEKP